MKCEMIVDEQLMQTGGTVSWPSSLTFIGSLVYTPIKLGVPDTSAEPNFPKFNTVDQIGEGSSASTGAAIAGTPGTPGSFSSSDGMTSFFLAFLGSI